MDSQRNLFVIALLFMSFIIWQTWEQDKNLKFQQQKIQTASPEKDAITNRNILFSKNQGKHITIKNDVLELTINTYGGDIEQASLLTYSKELQSKEPFRLLETTPGFVYQAQSGLTGEDGPDNPENGSRPVYNVKNNLFKLASNENELTVPMFYKDERSNIFIKTFSLKRGEYTVNVTYKVKNTGMKPLKIASFGQLKQSIDLPSHRRNTNDNFALHTFRGAAYSTSEEKYKKYKFNDIVNNKNLNVISEGGWVAMLQQYFATAWLPPSYGANNFYTSNLGNGIAAIGYKSQSISVQPGKTGYLQSTLWVGPEIQDKMAAIAPHLDLTVDYGWLWFISQPLFKLLKFTHVFLGNWGFSIIVITFIVRGIMYPLTKLQYTSIEKMRLLQPKIQLIRERLGNDKQRISQEMITLYKTEKINPLGGCFPLLIQMPIFLALYYMLIGSVELRHAPFTLWIRDLSAKDPYYILPILMGITMYLIQKMSPSNINDPMQKKFVIFMPVVFTIFFLWFPSGLVLYYIVSNLVSAFQQQLILYNMKKQSSFFRRKRKP